jgi:hypothetical protein
MKVILKDEEARLFYAGENRWVPELSGAVNFNGLEEAAVESLQWRERYLAILLKYENPEAEVALNPAYCMPARLRPAMSV